jgi:hypothetical protein
MFGVYVRLTVASGCRTRFLHFKTLIETKCLRAGGLPLLLRSSRRHPRPSRVPRDGSVRRHTFGVRASPSLRDSVPSFSDYPGLTSGANVCRRFAAGLSARGANGKGHLISQTGLYLMPATTYSPTHFRVQYNRPCEGVRGPLFGDREPFAEILSEAKDRCGAIYSIMPPR